MDARLPAFAMRGRQRASAQLLCGPRVMVLVVSAPGSRPTRAARVLRGRPSQGADHPGWWSKGTMWAPSHSWKQGLPGPEVHNYAPGADVTGYGKGLIANEDASC
jgi:hypothetical protein